MATKYYSIVILLVLLGKYVSQSIRNDGNMPKANEQEQTHAVRQLLKRLIPESSHQFRVRVNFSLGSSDTDIFKITSRGNKIVVTGNRGYSVASGVYYYLKHFCGCHVSWSGDQLHLPATLPKLESPIQKLYTYQYRYYMNVCTFSYSTVWWDWKRWQREIDWMALNGINLPLASIGQEAIWKKVFKTFQFTDHDIDEFFTGPAFLAWNRMGNLQGWAGPLSDSWLQRQLHLQHLILQRMRSFGMKPVLPAFSGRVPPSISRIYPNASISNLATNWGFDAPYSPITFLEPSDPLFENIGETFLRLYLNEFGTDNIYNADLFNEMIPAFNTTDYLAECGKSVYKTLISVDPNATWILQGWTFHFNLQYWTESRAKALLTSVPLGRMIVLDLQAELYPQYPRLSSYYGQPFIWCIIQNFGGVMGLYGSLPSINTGTFEGRSFNGSTMIGTGMAPEGIENNDVVFELMNEMAWRSKPVNLSEWINDFADRRYGVKSEKLRAAWLLLKDSVYNASAPFRNHGNYIVTKRPSFNLKPYVWYNVTYVFEAWRLFVETSLENSTLNNSQLFAHDLVDLTRQALQLVGDKLYKNFREAYLSQNWTNFREMSSRILDLYDDFEEILSTDKMFMLGCWLQSSQKWATNDLERKQYLYNSLNQITLWGLSGQILDYANKQWAGVMLNYFRKRWELFIEMANVSVYTLSRFNQTKYNDHVLDKIEDPFTRSDECYPVDPVGNATTIAHKLLQKYLTIINQREEICTGQKCTKIKRRRWWV